MAGFPTGQEAFVTLYQVEVTGTPSLKALAAVGGSGNVYTEKCLHHEAGTEELSSGFLGLTAPTGG